MSTAILSSGQCVHKSKPLPLDRAAAFARCITANASRFFRVEILPAPREKFRVQFATYSNSAYQAEYEKNAGRAAAEGSDYIYWQDTDNPRRVWVFNPASGETYPIDSGFCSCPQKQFRLNRAALHCKHEIEFDNRLAAGVDPFGTDKQTPTE